MSDSGDDSPRPGRRDRPGDHRNDPTRPVQFVPLEDADPPQKAWHRAAAAVGGKRWTPRRVALVASKTIGVLAAVAVFAATAIGWATTEWLNRQFEEVDALDTGSADIVNAPAQYGDENILLVGSDSRVGATAEDNVGDTSLVGGARADTIMIAHIPADRSRVLVVSFPRDLQVARPVCEKWNSDTGDYTGEMDPGQRVSKINTSYLIGGPKCVTKVVQQLSGLRVTHFLGIDFQGFKAMVDAVGGVSVCTERPLRDQELGVVLDKAGVSTINGATALNFVRARKVTGDPTGDYGRITRQQRFMSALLRKTLSTDTLFNIGKLRNLARAIGNNTFGDNIDVTTLLRLAQSLQGLNASKVTFFTVPTTGEANAYGNEELREADTDALFSAIISGDPIPGAAPATPDPSQSSSGSRSSSSSSSATEPVSTQILSPEDVRVRVLNGSGVTGVAAQTARELRAYDFGVIEIADAPSFTRRTTITYGPGREDAARTLATSVPGALVRPDSDLAGAIVLTLGADFDGDVLAPDDPTTSGASTDSGRSPALSGEPEVPQDVPTVNAADATCS